MSKQSIEFKNQILKFIEDNPQLSSIEIHDAFAAHLKLRREIDKGWSRPISMRNVKDIIKASSQK